MSASSQGAAGRLSNTEQTDDTASRIGVRLLPPYREKDADAESLIQRILSDMALMGDIIDQSQENSGLADGDETIVEILWRWLTSRESPAGVSSAGSKQIHDWYSCVRNISSMLPSMTPFELHALSTQSVVFTEGSMTYV